jgi:hypothetical protein
MENLIEPTPVTAAEPSSQASAALWREALGLVGSAVLKDVVRSQSFLRVDALGAPALGRQGNGN